MTEKEKDVAKGYLDLTFQSSPDFLRSLPGVDRVGMDPITYLGGSGPSLTAAPPFGPQEQEGAGREAEADGHKVLPVKRTLTMLESELSGMNSHMDVRGLHPRVPGIAGLAVDARGVAGAEQERGGILVGSSLPGLVHSHFGSTRPGRPGEPIYLQHKMLFARRRRVAS